jgi:hypothetical protein
MVLKYGNLNLLEPSGPAQACNGIALPFTSFLTTRGSPACIMRIATTFLSKVRTIKITQHFLRSGVPLPAILTCICLRRRLFLVTLEISRTAPWYRDVTAGHWPLLIRVSGIMWRGSKLLEGFRNFNIGTRYVCTCVGAGSGMGGGRRKTRIVVMRIGYIF